MAPSRYPNLFVSHSSSDTAVAKTIATSLADRFTVFLDAVDLRAGQNWQEKIERAIIACDAAIILLSPAMLARPAWVGAEAYFLSVRRRYFDPSLLVIPVLLPGFAAADLAAAAISPANLDEKQAVAIDPAALDLTALDLALAPIVQEYKARLPYQEIEEHVASLLAPLDVHAMGLMADALALSRDDLALLYDTKRWLAGQLLRADLIRLEEAHRTLHERDPAMASQVFRVVAPYRWVHEAAAKTLTREAIADPPKKPLGMNATEPVTPRLYVRRASMRVPEWWTFACDGDYSQLPQPPKLQDMLLDNIRRTLAEKLRFKKPDPTDAQLKAELQLTPEGRRPIVVQLPDWFAAMDGAALKAVRDVFPEFTFLFWTAKPDATLASRFADLVMLPAFDSDEEERIYRAYGRCLGDDRSGY